jgi:hypothetical protein
VTPAACLPERHFTGLLAVQQLGELVRQLLQ